MRLDDAPSSGNVEDRRGMRPAALGGGGVVLLIVGYLLFGNLGDAKRFAEKAGPVVNHQDAQVVGEAPKDGQLEFSQKIMGLTDEVWADQFREHYGEAYQPPKLVLFAEAVDTGCGRAPSAVGPFYCPADKKVYVDPTFFRELEKKLGGSAADFSKAYVIAHEVGHHVQNLVGYNNLLEKYRRREGENAGIRLELQADYLAGVAWHHAERKRKVLERGDVEAAITSAKAIGDDKLSGWRGNPEKFNHGTSAQRVKYFKQGLESGDASKRVLDRFFDANTPPLKL